MMYVLFKQGIFQQRRFFLLLEDLAKEYIYEIQIINYTPMTIKEYKNNIIRSFQFIKNEFEIVELEEVRPMHIKQYLNSMY